MPRDVPRGSSRCRNSYSASRDAGEGDGPAEELMTGILPRHPESVNGSVAIVNTPADTVQRLQAALDRLTDALEAHLEASLRRTSETDPAVQNAYTVLRHASADYDELLFESTGEVTPWEYPAGGELDVEFEDTAATPGIVGVMVRRDYEIADVDVLIGAGREAYTELYPEDAPETAVSDVTHPGRALYQLLHAYGVDGLDHRAEDSGLVARGGTVWVQALDEDDAATLADDPFSVADEEMLVYRLDEVVDLDDEIADEVDGGTGGTPV